MLKWRRRHAISLNKNSYYSELGSLKPCCLPRYVPFQISFLKKNGGIFKRKPIISSKGTIRELEERGEEKEMCNTCTLEGLGVNLLVVVVDVQALGSPLFIAIKKLLFTNNI